MIELLNKLSETILDPDSLIQMSSWGRIRLRCEIDAAKANLGAILASVEEIASMAKKVGMPGEQVTDLDLVIDRKIAEIRKLV